MIQGFEEINDEQFETLKNGISWITILIAGADGEIDSNETKWAKKIAEIRSYTLPTDLIHFYQEVGKDFSERIDALVEELPEDKDSRTQILTERLSTINDVLPKLNSAMAVELYESYLSFARHVAKSSGGFFGIGSISKEEEKLMGLSMINEVTPDEA